MSVKENRNYIVNDKKPEVPGILGLLGVLGMFTYWPIIIYIVSMRSKGIYIVHDVSKFNLYVAVVSVILVKILRVLSDKLEAHDQILCRNIGESLINFLAGIVAAAAISIFAFVLPSLVHK